MNRKKVIIGVLMAAIFIMMAFIPVANTTQLNNDKNTQEMNNKVNFIGLKNLLISIRKNDKLSKTIGYNGIEVHENTTKINSTEVKANFYVHIKKFDKNVSGSIIYRNNMYYIYNTNKNGMNSSSYMKISSKNGKIIYGPGGTYHYYVTGSGKASHTWHSSMSTGTWTACSQAITKTNTFFITWNGPRIVFLFGFIPALYLPTSCWHASNNNGWSLRCGGVEGGGTMMPVEGSKTVNNYYGSDTTMKITACWNYGVAGG